MRFRYGVGILFGVMVIGTLIGVLTVPRATLGQDGVSNLQETRSARQANRRATVNAVEANIQATASGLRSNAQATIEAAQATADGVRSNAQGTVEAAQANAQATAAALQSNAQGTATALRATVSGVQANVQATRSAIQTNIPATAAAVSTILAQSLDEIQATVTAVYEQIPEIIQELVGEELEEWLNYVTEHGSVEVDTDARTVRITYDLTETLVNNVLDAALVGAGYNPTAANTDFIPEGALVTVEGATITEDISGRLTMLYNFEAVDGRAQVTLVYATVNDAPLPDSVVAQLQDDFVGVVTSAITADIAYEYSVDALYTTDTSLVAVVTVPFQWQPQP